MKTKLFILALALCFFSGAHAQYTSANLKLESDAGKYRYKNVQIFPIRANSYFMAVHKTIGNYTTLQDALEKKKVQITEHVSGDARGSNSRRQQVGENSADVNTLFIENVGSDTIMVLSGEVIQGGKQNRMIAQDFLLLPRSGKVDVSVFCVEHGRWSADGDSKTFSYSALPPPNSVREAGTVKKNQQEVWDKVEYKVAVFNAEAHAPTGAITALEKSGDYKKGLEEYMVHFKTLFDGQENVIGFVVVAGNTILGSDMFATHALFMKHYQYLLRGYCAEAITAPGKVTVTNEQVNSYLQKIIKDEAHQDEVIRQNGTMLKEKNHKLHISTF